MRWRQVVARAPKGAPFVEGDPISDSDALRHGITTTLEALHDDPPAAQIEQPRRVPDTRTTFDEETRLTYVEPMMHAGMTITDTDRVLDRQRYLSKPARVIVEGDTITATLEVDGYVVSASLAAPEGTGGPDRHNMAALRRLQDAVSAVWREHTKAVG